MAPRWGPAGAPLSFKGASGREWRLTFELPLGARPESSSVWLVRDADTQQAYAAKRVVSSGGAPVDALVDDAAIWRAACLSRAAPIVMLEDVHVDHAARPPAVIYLAEHCARGHVPRGRKLGPRAVASLAVALLDAAYEVARAADEVGAPRAHGNVVYDSVFVGGEGRVRVGGFGAARVMALSEDPRRGLAEDMVDAGLLLYSVMFGKAPAQAPYAVFPEDPSPYNEELLGVLAAILEPLDDPGLPPADFAQVRGMAVRAGGAPDMPLVMDGGGGGRGGGEVDVPIPGGARAAGAVAGAVERAVDKMVEGVDAGGAYSTIVANINKAKHVACDAVFAALFRCPVSRDPIVAFRSMAMLHNLMLDGPDDVLDAVRRNDRFMEFAESSWTREKTRANSDPQNEGSHASSFCFVAGEIAFYGALLRRKARFHMLAAGSFTGAWVRTGAVNENGRDVIATRRRKVLGGMGDLTEMASELGVLLAQATDVESAVKHAGIRSLVDECGRAHDAALTLVDDCSSVESVEKLVPSYDRIWKAAKALVVAVRAIPAAGGQEWEEMLAGDRPREIVAEAELRFQEEQMPDMSNLEGIPEGAFGAKETKEEKAERKAREKEERRAQRKAEKAAARAAEAQAKKDALTAEDGAVVLHGSGDAVAAAVTTMFGDLLALDSDKPPPRPTVCDPRQTAGMSDAAALAAAFGVAPDAVAGQYLALPAPGGEGRDNDDYGSDGDDGGYEAYQARQEQESSNRARERRETSTGAWAARAGYGGMALVAAGASGRVASASGGRGRKASDGYSGNDSADSLDEDNYGRKYRDQDSVSGGSYQSVDYSVGGGADSGGYEGQGEVRSGGYDAPAQNGGYSEERHTPPPSKPTIAKATPLPKSLQVNMKRLRLGDKIGEGAFGVVYEGEYLRKKVAIKKMHKALCKNSGALNEFGLEVNLMCSIEHPNVLSCVAAKLTPPDVLLVTEFMKRGTLFDVLYRERIRLTYALVRKIAIQAAEGMEYLHEQGILHRDLKSSNLLVDTSYNVKLGDFGLAKNQESSDAAAKGGLSGTYQYMAPEILRGEPQSPKSDVYAYGLIVWEMVSGEPPFLGVDPLEAGRRVLNEGLRPVIPPTCSRSYAAIIQACWATSAAERPTFSEVLHMIKTTTK